MLQWWSSGLPSFSLYHPTQPLSALLGSFFAAVFPSAAAVVSLVATQHTIIT